MSIIFEIAGAMLFMLLLFSCVIHIFRIIFIIKTNIKNWHGGFIEWLSLVIVIADKYCCRLNMSFWIKYRTLIYKIIKNKTAIWILDSFLAFEIIKEEWREKKWKNLFLRGIIYYISNQIHYIPKIIYVVFFAVITIGAAWDLIKDFIYPYQTSFNFQALPFPIQQRFYELQPPVTKFRFSKAYFKFSFKSVYNKIFVDNLFIRRSKKCHMIYENFVRQQPPPPSMDIIVKPSLTIGCNIEAECKCPKEMLSNIFVVKTVYASFLPPNAFFRHISTVNFSNVKFLEIYQSQLSSNDLNIISTMALKFVTLHIYGDNEVFINDKIKDILRAVIGVPHLRIWYDGECDDPDEFTVYLVEWVLENGYIESLLCSGFFLNEKLAFRSSSELSIMDTFDSL